MRSHRKLSAAAALAAVAIAGCGGGEVAKPLAEDAARSAERSAARDAAAAAADSARSGAASAATSVRERSRDALEALAADDAGARAAICRRIDLLEVSHAEPDERAYAAYEQVATELMPFSEFVEMIDAVDALSDGDLDDLASTAGCL